MNKIIGIISLITISHMGFASNCIYKNLNIENEDFFKLCQFEVASLDDDGNVLEYINEEKEIHGRKDCLSWVNNRLEALEEQGYCLGQERVQYSA
nr:hypothetical protein [uncultured Flavobacterium sp.]